MLDKIFSVLSNVAETNTALKHAAANIDAEANNRYPTLLPTGQILVETEQLFIFFIFHIEASYQV